MVYCGSGTETNFFITLQFLFFMILWSTAEAVLRQALTLSYPLYFVKILWSTAEAVLRQKEPKNK